MKNQNRCYFCEKDDKNVLEEHHIIPRSIGTSTRTITLCRNCHKKLHDAIEPLVELVRANKPKIEYLDERGGSPVRGVSTNGMFENPNIINPTQMTHLSERQIRSIQGPTRWYAAQALKNGKWNLNWGNPREHVSSFRIENLKYYVDRPQNKDFAIVMYKLEIWNYEKWGSPEKYGVKP